MTAIVVINEDLPLATFLGDLLRTRTRDVVICCDGRRTYDMLNCANFDLIVLDLVTSKPEGSWDLLTFLQFHPILRHVPVIVCSGSTDDLMAKEYWLRKRSIGILIKPFDVEDLYQTVDNALQRAAITC